jgi:hypothetical protein
MGKCKFPAELIFTELQPESISLFNGFELTRSFRGDGANGFRGTLHESHGSFLLLPDIGFRFNISRGSDRAETDLRAGEQS